MNAYDLVKFIGHSSIYAPLEDYLDGLHVKWRPRITKSRLDTRHHIKELGIWIGFSISALDDGILVKSEGSYILESVELVLISNDSSIYQDELPRKLNTGDSRDNVREKLGTPTRINEDSDNYFLDGVVWIVAYEKNIIKFIQFMAPDDGWRKRGLCD